MSLLCTFLSFFGPLMAAEASFDISELLTTSVTNVQSELFKVIGIVVPAIVAVTAAVIGIKFGIRWMKKITG